jgi:hypothetical protein
MHGRVRVRMQDGTGRGVFKSGQVKQKIQA